MYSNDIREAFRLTRHIRFGIILSALIMCMGLLFWISNTAKASIALNYFYGFPGNQSVTLEWQTAAELNLSGFILYRSNNASGSYQRLNSTIISSTGNALLGDTYTYQDSNLTNGTEYFYRLDFIRSDQSVDSYYPLRIIPGANATGSAPLTPVTTGAINTVTVTGQTNTPTRSLTPNPQSTTTGPPAPTASPSETLTSTISPTPLSTQTPTIQVQIVKTITPVATQDISEISTIIAMDVITEVAQITPMVEETTPTPTRRDWLRIGILVLLGAIWLLLGAWFYYYLSRMQK